MLVLAGPVAPSADAKVDPLRSIQWALDAIHLGGFTQGPQPTAPAGDGAVVAVVDSGVESTHPDLQGRVTRGPDFVDNDGVPDDANGHGTHIAGPTWRGGDYVSVSGTSQSAAVASGVAALLVGLGLRGQVVIDRLEQTSRDIGAPGPDAAYGHGLLDAERALDGAAAGTLPAILRVSAAADQTITGVRRRGVKVSCDAARAGSCRVRVRVGASVVAKATARVDGTGPVDAIARLTTAGRKRLRGTRSRTVVVEAALAGAPGARASVRVRGHRPPLPMRRTSANCAKTRPGRG